MSKSSKSAAKESRPAIPEPIMREVRQNCFFGCILCGSPVFHYDHVEEYSLVKKHEASNIVLLCPDHHNAKTTNKLSVDRIRHAQKKPFNKRRTRTGKFELVNSKTIDIRLGTVGIQCEFPYGFGIYHCLWMNGFSYLSVDCEDGWLSLSLKLTDKNGLILLEIRKGQMVVMINKWDYTYVGDKLIIREGARDIILELKLSNESFHLIRGEFMLPSGDGFSTKPERVHIFKGWKPSGSIELLDFAAGNGQCALAIINPKEFPIALMPIAIFAFRH